MYKKMGIEISKTQSKMIRTFVVLLDDRVINSTVKLLDLLMLLLSKWMGIDYANLKHGSVKGYKPQELTYFMPEHFLENIYKFHVTNFKFKPNYLNIIGEEHIN
jgi:hypothetical protein